MTMPDDKTNQLDAELAHLIREAKFKIEINRGMKGQYGWTIAARGDIKEEVIKDITEIDNKLRELFGRFME